MPYAAATVGAFAVVAARERELARPVTLASLEGLGWERPFLGVAMWAFVLSMAGFPLTGGFFGKLFVFSADLRRGLVVARRRRRARDGAQPRVLPRDRDARSSCGRVSCPRTVVAAGGSPPRDLLLDTAVALALVVTIGSFFAVQPIVDVARDAAASLPF